ncbi:MAG: conjugative transfer ATPase [Candidatus Competibacteraceae bacterium]
MVTAALRRPPGLFARWWKRLLGDWPLRGEAPPLGQRDFELLFQACPAFADYLPFDLYDAQNQVFELDDGLSVAAVFRLYPADLEGRSPERLEQFNDQLDHALQSLPSDDDVFPYIAQLYLEDREPTNLAEALAAATPDAVRDSAFSQAWREALREHFDIMRSPQGIFDDERVRLSGAATKGWRAIDQQIHLCLYRKASKKAWQPRRYTPAQQLNQAISAFLSGLEALGVRAQRLDEEGLRHWLLPWLTPMVPGYDSPHAFLAGNPLPPLNERGAAWSLAQQVLQFSPQPIPDRDEERDRGVYRLGPVYTRYITLQGVEVAPDNGALTLDLQQERSVTACPWNWMPPETLFVWTIVPRNPLAIEEHLDRLQRSVRQTTSEAAEVADEELDAARAALRQHQRVFNVQMGLYLRAACLADLEDRTRQVENALVPTRLRPIPARYDLLADDSFVRNLPGVYDWRFDRLHSLRSRFTYSAHLAAILPFYGRSTGTSHPCLVMYRRDGQTFTLNPYHAGDRVRVAHMTLFGPTGSGKSATAIAHAMQSMAVNRPRQIIIEKGNSFGLMVAYYARLGIRTREWIFNRGQDVHYAPYVDTRQALAEHRCEWRTAGEEDEQRSYLAEMLYMTELMITGGRPAAIEALTHSDRAIIQSALIQALEDSEAAGLPHALPEDVYRVLQVMAQTETIPEIRLRIRNMADAMHLWTQGLRGYFFNRYGQPFNEEDDVVHIDLGILTTSGHEDMLALAVLSLLANITAWSEKHQASGRHTEVWFDEGHYISKMPITVKGFIVGTKVWRKLHTWLVFATQDFSDFSEDARQILSQAEFWFLLSMGPEEARRVAQFRDLSSEEQHLLTLAIKEPGRFVEGVLLSEKYPPALVRFVPPALALALAQTEGNEKNYRMQLMQKHGFSELDAALLVAREMTERRRQH